MKQLTFNDTLAHFNIERIKHYVGSDTETINYVLNLAIEELNASLQNIEHHVYNKNIKGIKETSHKLFGTSVTVGLEKLSLLARQLEGININNQILISELFSKMKSEIILVVKLLKQQIN